MVPKKTLVLVVDDSQYNLFVMNELLNLMGDIDVLQAINGQQAVGIVESHNALESLSPIGLVFMDL